MKAESAVEVEEQNESSVTMVEAEEQNETVSQWWRWKNRMKQCQW